MKFLKYLFTVPEGQKVTERSFKRVLISSVCGILLCMSCLMTSTWAWYTVSVESKPVTIQMASNSVSFTVNGESAEGYLSLASGHEAEVELTFVTDATYNDLNPNPRRYIVLSVYDESDALVGCYYVSVDPSTNTSSLTLSTDAACKVYFTPAWQPPLEGKELTADKLVLIDSPDDTTASTPASDENSDDQPGENNEQSTQNSADTKTDPQQTPTDENPSDEQPAGSDQDAPAA